MMFPARGARRRVVLWSAIGLILAGASSAAYLLARDDWNEEAEQLVALFELGPDAAVAEIGAGEGELTIEVAKRLPANTRMYSTELDRDKLEDIRRAVKRSGMSHIEVVEAVALGTNLPPGCCDAVFMRDVYHHITKPQEYNRSLRRTVKDGGMLAIIDFEPGGVVEAVAGQPEGTPKHRGGHGIPRQQLLEEITAAGFAHARTVDEWPGRNYLMLFRAVP
jgi:ubiquinone/menaquinone biosynthesis C-methylase UbiE